MFTTSFPFGGIENGGKYIYVLRKGWRVWERGKNLALQPGREEAQEKVLKAKRFPRSAGQYSLKKSGRGKTQT